MSKQAMIVAVVGVVLCGWPPAWAGPAGETKEGAAVSEPTAGGSGDVPCVTAVLVEGPVQWLSVLPQRQPPTTSRLSFDERGGAHVEIEWDPYDGRGLNREIALTKGTWQVSFWSEPQRNSLKFDENYAWISRATPPCPTWTPRAGSAEQELAQHVVIERGAGSTGDEAYVRIRAMERKRLGPLGAMSLSEKGGAGAIAGDLSRAFPLADVPDQVAEMLVRAVTRTVKRRAVRLATQRLEKILCYRRTEGAKEYLMPATCGVLHNLDLRSLSATARPAATALAMDLLGLAAERVKVRPAVVKRMLAASTAAVRALRNRPDISTSEIQGLFLTAAAAYLDDDRSAGMCSARLALSLISYCHASNQCGAGFIRDVVTHPHDYFDARAACAETWKPLTSAIDRIEAAVADGRKILDAAKGVNSAERLKALARVSLRLLEITACDGTNENACTAASQLCAIGSAAVEGDMQETIRVALRALAAEGNKILPWTDRQKKFATLFFNFVGEAAAVVPGSPEEAKAAQARVEHALETVLDVAANRDGRDGDWIVGLGTGLRASARWEGGRGVRGPVSVPLALTLDGLSSTNKPTPGKARGYHFEVSFLDAGNYLRVNEEADTDEVHWADVATLSIGAGYFTGDDAMPLYVGASGGLVPGPDEDGAGRRWSWHLGLQAGVYFPLIDFN